MKKEENNNFNLSTSKNLLGGGLEKQNNSNKLERFTKNKNKKKVIIFSVIGLVLLVGMVTLYRTFALYEEKLEFNVLHGRVPEYTTGDVKIAAVIDGVSSSTIPGKNDGYVVESINCDNGATGKWDNNEWGLLVSNLTKTKTTCTLVFKKMTFADYITILASTSEELVYDGTADNNLRYVGADPNNYVLFNGELWSIIGVMNNIKDSEGNIGSHVKIVRSESIGKYSWDNQDSLGNNDWSQSAIMKVLNSGAYWNRTSGTCPYGGNGATTSCNFSSTGLTDEAKSMISNVVWNLGAIDYKSTPSAVYNAERGNTVPSGHATTWTGSVGLIYPSDYGLSVGGEDTFRDSCMLQNMNGSSFKVGNMICMSYAWLYYREYKVRDYYLWTITPTIANSYEGIYVEIDGGLSEYEVSDYDDIFPSVYLNSNVELTGNGDGSKTNPYNLKLGS